MRWLTESHELTRRLRVKNAASVIFAAARPRHGSDVILFFLVFLVFDSRPARVASRRVGLS